MNNLNKLKSKKVLITGGTGSFGKAFLNKALEFSEVEEIRIFSRDEKKQDDLRKKINDERVRFYIGDVRDINSLNDSVKGVDYIFHAAALKQVPTCEFFPLEAVKTNVMGTENVLQSAIDAGVERVICLSTDKAVYPINAMGTSKAMMEKVSIAKSRDAETVICVTRYGNVLGSRGSIVPLIKNQIESGNPITITDPSMTRFMMTLDEAVELVLFAFENGDRGDVFVQKSPAATIATLVESLKIMLNSESHEEKIIGTRHGEKLFEVLVSREEMAISKEIDNYYRVPIDERGLNYSAYIDSGDKRLSSIDEYTSHNTHLLEVEGMIELLNKMNIEELEY